MSRATNKSAQPYRQQIVGLPLQRSLFTEAAKAAPTIGLPGLSRASDFPARLDANGDLFLDRSQVEALREALLSRITPEHLDLMHKRHRATYGGLVQASANASRVAASHSAGSARVRVKDLADRTALVMAYGILSKFVPDVLLRALTDAGDAEPPPFPEESAGSLLLRDMFELYKSCSTLGYTPQRLQQDWPRVSPEAFCLVSEFCSHQRGFGPLAWDSPGYEDPIYVVRLLHSAFDQVDVEEVRQRLSSVRKVAVIRSTDVTEKVVALRRVLALWLEFLERETWYVRRAFYVGMVPLLHRLAAEYRRSTPGLRTTDLLFLEIGELAGGIPNQVATQARRDRYMEDTEYLALHGVNAQRIANMLENP